MLPITRATVQSFCRTCLQELNTTTTATTTTKQEPIYDIQSENLVKWLSITTSIEQLQDDVYPRNLCHPCYIKVRTFYEFREKSLCSTEALKELLTEELTNTMRSNLQKFCRTCLNPLKSMTGCVGLDTVRQWLAECIGIVESENGEADEKDFPKQLCSWCYKKLRNYVEFRGVAKQSFEYLDSVLGVKGEEEMDVKVEPPLAATPQKSQDEEITSCSLQSIQPETSSNIFAEQLPVVVQDATAADDAEMRIASNTVETEENIEKISNSGFGDNYPVSDVSEDSDDIPIMEKIKNFKLRNKNERLAKRTRTRTKSKKEDAPPVKIKKEADDEIAASFEEELKLFDSDDKPQKAKKSNSTIIKGKRMQCPKCDKKFQKQITFDAHMRSEHEGVEKPFTCEHCPSAYRMMHFLKRHIKECHGGSTASGKESDVKMLKCDFCCKEFKRKEHLRDHTRAVHHRIRPFKCSYCDKAFGAPKTCRVHEMSHTGQRPFACEKCPKTFRQKNDLKNHQELHTTSPDLLCPICRRAKPTVEELQQHVAKHKTQCATCGKIFTKTSHLHSHEQAVHLKLRPFKCKTCGKSFALARTLQNHELVHSDERTKVCTICQATFKYYNSLKSHMKSHEKLKKND